MQTLNSLILYQMNPMKALYLQWPEDLAKLLKGIAQFWKQVSYVTVALSNLVKWVYTTIPGRKKKKKDRKEAANKKTKVQEETVYESNCPLG